MYCTRCRSNWWGCKFRGAALLCVGEKRDDHRYVELELQIYHFCLLGRSEMGRFWVLHIYKPGGQNIGINLLYGWPSNIMISSDVICDAYSGAVQSQAPKCKERMEKTSQKTRLQRMYRLQGRICAFKICLCEFNSLVRE
jgi:hypothetical protein